jgi:hypothetical protein
MNAKVRRNDAATRAKTANSSQNPALNIEPRANRGRFQVCVARELG